MNEDLFDYVAKNDDLAHRLSVVGNRIDACFWEFWNLVLSDDHGVNEQAYRKLYELAGLMNKAKNDEVCVKVQACEGRFYLKG